MYEPSIAQTRFNLEKKKKIINSTKKIINKRAKSLQFHS